MAILPILVAPHPVLRKKCVPVDSIGDTERKLLDDMLETMYDAPGIGLAAPQIGVAKRMLVMDIARANDAPTPLKIINPEITAASEELYSYEEGCLSYPEQYADVKRPAKVTVTYLDETGAEQVLEAEGLTAVCIQHEIDHLDGINFVDHISSLKRGMIMRRLKKEQARMGKNNKVTAD